MAYETERDSRHGGAGSFAAGVLIGAAIGAGLALLLAPKSGRAIREDLAERARKARESAAEGYRHSREKVGEIVGKGREAYEKARGVAQRTKEDIKQNVHDLVAPDRDA